MLWKLKVVWKRYLKNILEERLNLSLVLVEKKYPPKESNGMMVLILYV